LDLGHHDPIPTFVGEKIGLSNRSRLQKSDRNSGPVEWDRWIGPPIPFPLKRVLRLRRRLHPRISSGGILRNQADRGKTWTFHSPGSDTG